MKITIAKSAGFCFGVKRAIKISLEAAGKEKPLYMLGDIVHNEDVVKSIEKAGIEKIKNIRGIIPGSLLIRAHGSSKSIFKEADKYRFKIIDATCPMVKEIHKIVIDMDKKGYTIVVIGDPKHDEVLGITGQIRTGAIVLGNHSSIKKLIPKALAKAAVVVQSTQNLDKVLKMLVAIKKRVKDLKFYNTICAPTRLKQSEIKAIPLQNGCVIVIGSKNSANTKRLYEIAKSLNKNSHWVNSAKNIRKGWFKGVTSVGITAGASTPDETIKQIKGYIQKITSSYNMFVA